MPTIPRQYAPWWYSDASSSLTCQMLTSASICTSLSSDVSSLASSCIPSSTPFSASWHTAIPPPTTPYITSTVYETTTTKTITEMTSVTDPFSPGPLTSVSPNQYELYTAELRELSRIGWYQYQFISDNSPHKPGTSRLHGSGNPLY